MRKLVNIPKLEMSQNQWERVGKATLILCAIGAITILGAAWAHKHHGAGTAAGVGSALFIAGVVGGWGVISKVERIKDAKNNKKYNNLA